MSDNNKNQEMSEEDYLKRHLSDLETGKQQTANSDISFAEPSNVDL